MKFIIRTIWLLAPGVFLFCAACSHTIPLKVAGLESFAGSSDLGGEIIVNAIKTTNTVMAIDAAHRRVTLKNANTGKIRQYKAGPQVVNFNLIKVGDIVNATVVERMSLFFEPETRSQNLSGSSLVVQSVAGAKPDVVGMETLDFTAKILDINNWLDQVTLLSGDGVAHTITVSEAVNLANFNVGDEVSVRITEALAILIEKP
jgi:hypothetical protein